MFFLKQIRPWALSLAVACGLAAPAYAASDYLLQLEGIPGESDDASTSGAIDLEGYSHDIKNVGKGGRGGGGGGAGKASFSDFSIMKRIDKASPLLMKGCASGKHFPTAIITVRKKGAAAQETYMEYKLSDCLISSYSAGGAPSSGDEHPPEALSFSYAKIEWTYTVRQDGQAPQVIHGGWDLKANKSI